MKVIKIILNRVLPVAFLTFLMLLIYMGRILMYPQDVFQSSYQCVIQNKYSNLVRETNPKIIIVGGSSAGFGINEKLLSKKTGYPVVNLGLHAGFGSLFNTEIAKANIRDGDIVLLGYEYYWWKENSFKNLGVDLVMSGIDDKIEMYKVIPLRNWIEIIGYLPDYYKKKVLFEPAEGIYSRSSFDENGYMTLQREFSLQNYEEDIDYYGTVDLDGVRISQNAIQYLKNFKKYVEGKGGKVYFIAPPLFEKAKKSDDHSFRDVAIQVEEKIGIPYISDPIDYIFSEEYIFDTIYHCSSKGEIKRTELLISDLEKYQIV